MITQGQRVYPDERGHLRLAEGDYGFDGKHWWARAPGQNMGYLDNHQITEHEDGTITVSPSILMTDGQKTWHGYLEHGVWREV